MIATENKSVAELRKLARLSLSIDQINKWRSIHGNPVGFWTADQCRKALENPDASGVESVKPSNGTSRVGDDDAAQNLIASLKALMVGAVDENRVREIVEQAIGDNEASEARVRELVQEAIKAIKADRFEVVQASGEVKEIKGRPHAMFKRVLALASMRKRDGMHPAIMLVGPAGCGKSVMAQQIGEALGLRYGHISLTAGISESSLIGRYVPSGEGGRFEYVLSMFADFFQNGGVMVLEEMDSADANVLLVINNAVANGHLCTADPKNPIIEKHPDFVMLACCNTFGRGADREYVGRNQLDAATLDRFAATVTCVDYDEDMEREIGGNDEFVKWAQALRAKVREVKIRRVVSTRTIFDLCDQIGAGVTTLKAAKDQMLEGWTADERAKVGDLAR